MKINNLPNEIRKKIHPLLLKSVKNRIYLPIQLLNSMPDINGNKIFAVNHSCVLDAPVSSVIIKEHFYFLVGKQSLNFIDKLFFFLNGVIYVDRKNKSNKKKSLKKMSKLLKEEKSLLIFPEGTWNVTPSKPIIPLHWGIIDLAKQTNVPIIPIVIEYCADCCYVKYGVPIYITEDMDKQTGIIQLEDAMATLKWDIWETFSMKKRTNEMQTEFEEMIQKRVTEYPKFNFEYEMSVIRDRINTPEYVFGK